MLKGTFIQLLSKYTNDDFLTNDVYNPGRKSVLKHFLSMDRIFKTDFFYNKFEAQARKNLTNELNNANKGIKE